MNSRKCLIKSDSECINIPQTSQLSLSLSVGKLPANHEDATRVFAKTAQPSQLRTESGFQFSRQDFEIPANVEFQFGTNSGLVPSLQVRTTRRFCSHRFRSNPHLFGEYVINQIAGRFIDRVNRVATNGFDKVRESQHVASL